MKSGKGFNRSFQYRYFTAEKSASRKGGLRRNAAVVVLAAFWVFAGTGTIFAGVEPDAPIDTYPSVPVAAVTDAGAAPPPDAAVDGAVSPPAVTGTPAVESAPAIADPPAGENPAPSPETAAEKIPEPAAKEAASAKLPPQKTANIQLLPWLDMMKLSRRYAANDTNSLLLGLLIAGNYNLAGFGFAGIGLINIGDLRGMDLSPLFNFTMGNVSGVQLSGLFNTAGGNVTGVQVSGLFNLARGKFRGFQAAAVNIAGEDAKGVQIGLVNLGGSGLQIGLVNISRSEKVIPLGLVNVVPGGIIHGAVWIDNMEFINLSFRSGSKYFYTIFMAGTSKIPLGGDSPGIYMFADKDLMVSGRGGVGFELPLKAASIDIDVLGGFIANLDKTLAEPYFADAPAWLQISSPVSIMAQLRFSAGFNVWKHLGVFAGISWDYVVQLSEESPVPGNHNIYDFNIGDDPLQNHRIGFFFGLQF